MTTYLFDHNLSADFARALHAVDDDVRALSDEFPTNVEDVDLILALGERGWVLISHDRSMRTRPKEAAALRQSGITAVYLGPFWRKLRRWDQFVWLARNWPKIQEFVNSNPRGTIGVAQQNGNIKVAGL